MMRNLKRSLGLVLLSCVVCSSADGTSRSLNVLFIAIDDLRPELGCYGNTEVKSPNIDRLAGEGMVFDRAYCQQALCGPSRLSVMTGRYPYSLGTYGMGRRIEWRDYFPDLTSLPQQFRNNGYYVRGIGKVYDNRLGVDNAGSWSEPHTATWRAHFADRSLKKENTAVECADVPDSKYTDGNAAEIACDFLRSYDRKQPFFLALGFSKPHLPFVAPKKYWDLYDRESIDLPAVGSPPEGCTDFTLSPYKEIADYGVKTPVDEATTRELRHGYLACVSYVDAQLGKVIAVLKERGMLDHTIIVIWGDHGFKLGDYGEWAKHTNLELDARVPLIIRTPKGRPGRTESLVELVDLYPTLCGLAGLPVPDSCEGKSLLPILGNPQAKVRGFALSQYPRNKVMGYSMRTGRWRYTEWRRKPNGAVVARELYDLKNGGQEIRNVLDAFPEVAEKQAALLGSYLKSAKIRQETIEW